MRPRTMMIATVLAALSFSAGSRAEDALLLSDATRSDGASFIEQLRAAPKRPGLRAGRGQMRGERPACREVMIDHVDGPVVRHTPAPRPDQEHGQSLECPIR